MTTVMEAPVESTPVQTKEEHDQAVLDANRTRWEVFCTFILMIRKGTKLQKAAWTIRCAAKAAGCTSAEIMKAHTDEHERVERILVCPAAKAQTISPDDTRLVVGSNGAYRMDTLYEDFISVPITEKTVNKHIDTTIAALGSKEEFVAYISRNVSHAN